MYDTLKWELPFTDFCVYDGRIFNPLQHHVSVNHAVYIETNRDTVDAVFGRLREQFGDVFKQPSTSMMSDYVDLSKPCIIIKALVTEAPITMQAGVCVPAIEKLLVDIQKD